MVVALNRGTQILIDNFIDKHFSGSDKVAVKQEALEIANSIIEQNNKDLDKLATKGDLKDEIVLLKNDLNKIESKIDKVESKLEVKIAEIKADLLRWLVTTQIAIVGLLFALIKLTQN